MPYDNIIVSKLDAPQIVRLTYDEANAAMKTIGVGGTLVPEGYDHIVLTYVASGPGAGQVQTATYSKAGTQVAVLTLTYNASSQLIDVLRT